VVPQEQRQQMLRDIKILSDAQAVPGLLSFLGAYLVPKKEQVCVCICDVAWGFSEQQIQHFNGFPRLHLDSGNLSAVWELCPRRVISFLMQPAAQEVLSILLQLLLPDCCMACRHVCLYC
jgi:hypothetical protein